MADILPSLTGLTGFAAEPLTVSTLDDAAEILTLSFAAGFEAVFPRGPTPAMYAYRRSELVHFLARAENELPSVRYPSGQQGGDRGNIRTMVYRHWDSGQIAGITVWDLYDQGLAPEHGPVLSYIANPPGADALQSNLYHEQIHVARERYMGEDKTHVYAMICAVAPWFRGSGAQKAWQRDLGRVCVHEWCNAPVYLEALPLARKVWARYGWIDQNDGRWDITTMAEQIREQKIGSSRLRFTVHPMIRPSFKMVLAQMEEEAMVLQVLRTYL